MTAEFKVILDGYLQWCRENNKEPYADNGVTDVNMKNVNRLCDMCLSVHLPDLEQCTHRNLHQIPDTYWLHPDLEQCTHRTPTERTPTEAAKIFMRIVEEMSESTGIDREIVFRDLLQFVSGPDELVFTSLAFDPNYIDKTALDFIWACAGLLDSSNWNRDNMGCTESTFAIPSSHSRYNQ